MNLPLMSPAALDKAVYDLIARELGVANAMRFIARHNRPDGMDYTRDRNNWLPQDPGEADRLMSEPNPDFERLVAATQKKKRKTPKNGGHKKK